MLLSSVGILPLKLLSPDIENGPVRKNVSTLLRAILKATVELTYINMLEGFETANLSDNGSFEVILCCSTKIQHVSFIRDRRTNTTESFIGTYQDQ